jgi:ATP-dependent exoDNAse (exonuclease V) beta subunit
VAAEIARLAAGAQVRYKQSGDRRPNRPADIAILFRSRVSHREFEEALEARGIPAYVYKGLGFFDADEIKTLRALVPASGIPITRVGLLACPCGCRRCAGLPPDLRSHHDPRRRRV